MPLQKADGPCYWMSHVVCIPKAKYNSIRLCVDMRRDNAAIKCERYPILVGLVSVLVQKQKDK